VSVAMVLLTPEELDAIVRKAVRAELAKQLPVDVDVVLTRAEVAKMLRVDPKVVTQWVRRRGLPGHKVVGEWRFHKAAILRWREDQH
jgi:excisionase family DNA binding protein